MNQQSLIYKFIFAPQFRVWRYCALFLFFITVSLNQGIITYSIIFPIIGNKVFLIIGATLLIYLVTLFLLYNTFIPRYLNARQYFRFMLSIVLTATIFVTIPNIVYFFYYEEYEFLTKETLLDDLTSFIIYLLCISGITAPILLKNWITSSQYLYQLRKKQKSSQIEQMKEQINPASFFKILNRSAALVKSEPDKASSMLMKLSLLLRYQLYDCNMDQVLLTAEISFLRNFLELESLYSSKFDYAISSTGNLNGIVIPSSILLPYIQNITNALNLDNEYNKIDIHIGNNKQTTNIAVEISGNDKSMLLEKELLDMKERLNILYKDSHILAIRYDEDSQNRSSLSIREI